LEGNHSTTQAEKRKKEKDKLMEQTAFDIFSETYKRGDFNGAFYQYYNSKGGKDTP